MLQHNSLSKDREGNVINGYAETTFASFYHLGFCKNICLREIIGGPSLMNGPPPVHAFNELK